MLPLAGKDTVLREPTGLGWEALWCISTNNTANRVKLPTNQKSCRTGKHHLLGLRLPKELLPPRVMFT
jgi:hypothetical protein